MAAENRLLQTNTVKGVDLWDSAVFELELLELQFEVVEVIVDRWGSGGRSRSEVVDASGAVLKAPEVDVIFVDSVQDIL